MSLRALHPAGRIAAIADAGSIAPVDASLAAARPSPHLARWGIAARDDDGITLARAAIEGRPVLVAAQDERFVGGSVGEHHGKALMALLEKARAERPAAVVLLLASGGVRLHEANAAELALARALRALLDARAAGVPVLALGVGDVFGGASVLAFAADRLAMLPRTRLGLSGPRVIEVARGSGELDAADHAAVDALFGAEARAAAGHLEVLVDDARIVRAWIALCSRDNAPFASRVVATQARLAARLAAAGAAPAQHHDRIFAVHNEQPTPPGTATSAGESARPRVAQRDRPPHATATIGERESRWLADATPLDDDRWLWKLQGRSVWVARSAGAAAFGPLAAHRLDDALLAHLAGEDSEPSRTLIIIEDSAGHETSRSAEALCVAQYLAQHAAVLALLRSRGVALRGLLTGNGHSAAFFANALQASVLLALETARVIAMDPAAIARVTRVDPDRLVALIEDDPLLGQPVRCFARSGGIARILNDAEVMPLDEPGSV